MKFKKKQDHQYHKPTQITDDFTAALVGEFPIEDDFILDLTALKIIADTFQKIIPAMLAQQKNNRSFVVVYDDVSIADDFEIDVSVVPTYHEALDVLELDRITRDLGF